MKDVSLGQLMRFGLAGGIFVGLLLFGFSEPRSALTGEPSSVVVGLAFAVSLLSGTVIYSLHRAMLFPQIRRALFRFVQEERSALEVDMERWSLSIELGEGRSMQSRLVVWADQIHFLYCAAWGTLLALLVGRVVGWSLAFEPVIALGFAAAVLVTTLVSNYQYQLYEVRVMKADRERLAQLTSAST